MFGRVVEGMAVVDAISGVKTGTRGRFRDVPTDPDLDHQGRSIAVRVQGAVFCGVIYDACRISSAFLSTCSGEICFKH